MVQEIWIINYLKMYKISDKVMNLIEKTMKTWRVEWTAGGKSLAEVEIEEECSQEMHYNHYYS